MDGEVRDLSLKAAADAALDFPYFDRRYDEELPEAALDDAIARSVVTVEEIVAAFECQLRTAFGPGGKHEHGT